MHINGKSFYNYFSIIEFMLKYLLCGTNFPGINLSLRNPDGSLRDESLDSIYRIHPRILCCLFDSFSIFDGGVTENELQSIEKQCSILFGQGKTINDPNDMIMLYCNLVAFWDKFGMNYNDIMRLPKDTFFCLKKIMNLEGDYRAKALESPSGNSSIPSRFHRRK